MTLIALGVVATFCAPFHKGVLAAVGTVAPYSSFRNSIPDKSLQLTICLHKVTCFRPDLRSSRGRFPFSVSAAQAVRLKLRLSRRTLGDWSERYTQRVDSGSPDRPELQQRSCSLLRTLHSRTSTTSASSQLNITYHIPFITGEGMLYIGQADCSCWQHH